MDAITLRSILLTMLASASADMAPFIVGGQTASISDWPFIAFLSITGDGMRVGCGGSLISSQTILTAAHCVDDILEGRKERFKRYDFRIYMGNSRYLDSTMQRRVIDYQSHEEYYFMDGKFDISVMFLSSKVDFSESVKKAILVKQTDFTPWNEPSHRYLEVAGWGAVQKQPDPRNQEERYLKRLGQVMFQMKKCRYFMRKSGIIKGVICAGKINASNYAYVGDSGGPLVRKSDKYQVGIVSIRLETYGVTLYTKVPHYYSWIRRTQKHLFNENC